MHFSNPSGTRWEIPAKVENLNKPLDSSAKVVRGTPHSTSVSGPAQTFLPYYQVYQFNSVYYQDQLFLRELSVVREVCKWENFAVAHARE